MYTAVKLTVEDFWDDPAKHGRADKAWRALQSVACTQFKNSCPTSFDEPPLPCKEPPADTAPATENRGTLQQREAKLHHASDDERHADQDHHQDEREENRDRLPRRGVTRLLLHLVLSPTARRPVGLPVLLGRLDHG